LLNESRMAWAGPAKLAIGELRTQYVPPTKDAQVERFAARSLWLHEYEAPSLVVAILSVPCGESFLDADC